MMIMDKRNEIYELGKKVDLLQQLNCKTDNKQEILELIDSITVYFENNDGDNTDIDYNVVYFYTKANYLTVLIEVVKTQKIKLYESNNSLSYGTEDEMLYDFTVLRLSYLRKALQLYNLCEKSDVAEAWMLQVYVNLANLYMETGRVVESIQVLETCKFSFGMALGNYAAKIYQLSTCTLDEHEQKELLLFAKYHYHILSENSETSLVPQDILESFKKAENHVDIVLKDFFEESLKNILSLQGRQYRMNRSIQIEGAFGVLKYDYGFRRFLTCGKTNVKTEFLLLCMGYNINKLHAKIQNDRLKSYLFDLKTA